MTAEPPGPTRDVRSRRLEPATSLAILEGARRRVRFSAWGNKTMRGTTAGFVSLALILSLAAPLRAEPFDDAADAFKRGDYPTALKLLRPLADHGDPAAQNNLGVMYMLGKGVQKDDAT